MNHLETSELLAVLKVAREHSTRDWCMVLLAYRHGLRASEVCELAAEYPAGRTREEVDALDKPTRTARALLLGEEER
jgi:integrase